MTNGPPPVSESVPVYAAIRAAIRLVAALTIGSNLVVSGLENVPRSGGLLVVANHSAMLDAILLPAYLPRGDSWSMAKSEFFQRGPVLAFLFRAFHSFPVVRESADRAALKRGLQVMKEGGVLILYPEGKVSWGAMQAALPGAGFLARAAGVPVLPVALVGTHEVMPQGRWWPRRLPVEIRFGKPISFPTGEGRPSHGATTEVMMRAIAELLPERLRGPYQLSR